MRAKPSANHADADRVPTLNAMSCEPRDSYLETQVLTAPPQGLRLMLIEAAIRDLDLTEGLWQQERNEPALEALIRCRSILSELIAGIQPDASPLAQKVLGLYVFLYTALTEAQISRDRQKLAHVRRVLISERETWREVCRQLAGATRESAAPAEESLALSLEA